MARPRKRHVQQELRYPDKNGQRRGRRVGDKTKNKPGRKPTIKGRPGSPHKARPELNGRCPVHVVLRVHRDVGSLRKRHMYKALREATLTVARREVFDAEVGAFRIVHVSIQRTHVHLLVEAGDRVALSRGMQGFQISAAKHINREYSSRAGLDERRRGVVFPDRFHEESITPPTQARRTLSYVLKNASHCTFSGRRVVLPTSRSTTWLLRSAERAFDYGLPRPEDFVWNRTPLIALADQINLQIRHSAGVPQQLYS